MNVALILVSLGIATGPEPLGHPLLVGSFDDMKSCVEAANHAQLPVAGSPGPARLNTMRSLCACQRKNRNSALTDQAIKSPSSRGSIPVTPNCRITASGAAGVPLV